MVRVVGNEGALGGGVGATAWMARNILRKYLKYVVYKLAAVILLL